MKHESSSLDGSKHTFLSPDVSEEEDSFLSQPFPTLRQVLESIDEHTGFNIEIKYPMYFKVIHFCSFIFDVF